MLPTSTYHLLREPGDSIDLRIGLFWAIPTTGTAEELLDIAGVRPAAAQARAALEESTKNMGNCISVIMAMV